MFLGIDIGSASSKAVAVDGDGVVLGRQVVNIGTGKEVSIRTLAETIARKVGFGGDIVFDPSKPDGTMRKLTDPSKLHALGWTHRMELDRGIETLYDWYLKK